ncbi:hypothetical protein CC78DRAFT_579777 [Lojkania enalia]|uniref:Uncharacterized protein n=1 Tax=Lojkania enalia TaxID=147567 RepID=A0A9P4N8J3_9PLEO|nr:hypothetical protein CC78DRAFT_579777 [Didymosphaeria enalia]
MLTIKLLENLVRPAYSRDFIHKSATTIKVREKGVQIEGLVGSLETSEEMSWSAGYGWKPDLLGTLISALLLIVIDSMSGLEARASTRISDFYTPRSKYDWCPPSPSSINTYATLSTLSIASMGASLSKPSMARSWDPGVTNDTSCYTNGCSSYESFSKLALALDGYVEGYKMHYRFDRFPNLPQELRWMIFEIYLREYSTTGGTSKLRGGQWKMWTNSDRGF